MTGRRTTLDSDPGKALEVLRKASRARPVVVFKKSPICPISHAAEAEFTAWLESSGGPREFDWAVIDVIAERELVRGLTKELGVKHESPQALWFEDGELAWHASHSALTRERFAAALSAKRPADPKR